MEIRHLPQAPTGLRPLAPGGGIDAHRHDTHQIVYARHGVLSVTTGAGTWVAPPNRALWIPAGTVHEHRAHGATEVRLVGLTANPLGLGRPAVLAVDPLLRELIIAYTDEPDPTPAEPGVTAHPVDRPRSDASGPGGDAGGPGGDAGLGGDASGPGGDAGGLGRDAGLGGDASGPGGDAGGLGGDAGGIAGYAGGLRGDAGAAGERGRLLAVLLDRLRRSPEQPLHLPTPRDPRLAAVCAALHTDPADPRTLARHAAEAGTSDRTLARLCRAELGMTFPQWRTQLRLHHALLLLAEGAAVTQVAHRCGWSSASAFIDVFRSVLGYTPGRAFTM